MWFLAICRSGYECGLVNIIIFPPVCYGDTDKAEDGRGKYDYWWEMDETGYKAG